MPSAGLMHLQAVILLWESNTESQDEKGSHSFHCLLQV